jgi:hypothetical protein
MSNMPAYYKLNVNSSILSAKEFHLMIEAIAAGKLSQEVHPWIDLWDSQTSF